MNMPDEIALAEIKRLNGVVSDLDDALAEAELTLAEKDELIAKLCAEIQRMVADRSYVAA